MAHISMRNLYQIRLINTHFFTINRSILTPSNQNHYFSSSSSVPYIKKRRFSVYHPSIKVIESCKNTNQIFQIHSKLVTLGLLPFWAAKLLKCYYDFGHMDYTISIFNFIDCPTTFLINNVIKACLFSSNPCQALGIYINMLRNGIYPNSYTFVSLFSLCAKMGWAEFGKLCHGQALKSGFDFVLPLQNSLIHFYGSCGDIGYARKVFDEMSESDIVSWNSIVSLYVNVGEMNIAHDVFNMMREKNVVSWNVLISGYMKANKPGYALMLFRRMVKCGLRGNVRTMVSLISACGMSARLKEGRSVHGFLIKMSKFSTILLTSLIHMYSKCRKVEVARRIFDGMKDRNIISWNVMILGHCIHGNPADGINLFTEMLDLTAGAGSIFPDEITYIGVLCACARAGLLLEGKIFFSQMMDTYSLRPNFAHYWCMANLYAGGGLNQEAENVLRSMPKDDTSISAESLAWVNLLTLCRFQADVFSGERIAKLLIDIEPQNFSHYRLLMNIYAVAGKWDNVARIKELVKEKGLERVPGCNLVDLKEIVHDYRVEHLFPEGMNEMNLMIDEIAES